MSKVVKKKIKKKTGRAAYDNGEGIKAGKHNQHLLSPEILAIVRRQAYLGSNKKRLCYLLGISKDTFTRYSKQFPEFDAAYKEGRAKVVSDLLEVGIELALKRKSETMVMNMLQILGKGYVDYPEDNETAHQSNSTSMNKDALLSALKKDKFIDIIDVSPEHNVIDVGGKDAKKDGKKG